MSNATARAVEAPLPLPEPPFDVAVLGAGRVGGAFARALEAAGHRIVATLRSGDDPSGVADASVIVIAVPDDALTVAAGLVARLGRRGSVVLHTSGLSGLEPLRDCGRLVAAVHPAVPVASPEHDLRGTPFGVTCAPGLEEWCARFVADLGGTAIFIAGSDRVRYHAALAMASNFAVTLAGDAGELLGDHALLVPLLRATVENIDAFGPDAALTGPVVRGDAGTVRAHLAALPPHLRDVYVANARRTLARAQVSGRLGDAAAARIAAVLDGAAR